MSRVNKGVVWLVLVGVFLAGGVAGGFVSLRVWKTIVDRGRGPDFSMRQMNRLVDELHLTEDQQSQIKPIIEETWKNLREYRHQSIEAMRGMEAQVMAQLTPEQKTHYTEIQEQQRERWKKLMEKRGPGGKDREGDMRGPPPPDGEKGEAPMLPPPEEPPASK